MRTLDDSLANVASRLRAGLARLLTVVSLAASSAALAGCGAGYPEWVSVSSVRIAGREHFLHGAAPDELETVPAIADQASQDFPCSASDVHVFPANPGFSHRVEGCGHHGVYEQVCRSESTRGAPGYEGQLIYLSTCRFVRLDDHPREQLDRFDADYGWPTTNDSFARRYENLVNTIDLMDQGAADLGCPRDQVVPAFWRAKTPVPVVEGCGMRGTYLPGTKPPFLIQSRVKISGT